jgi:hypothetical protein
MANYPATTDLAALVTTNPTDLENPSLIGAALRETRLVLLNVVELMHLSTGAANVVTMVETNAGDFASTGSGNNVWVPRVTSNGWTLSDNGGNLITAAGGAVFSFNTIGKYLFQGRFPGYAINRHQVALTNVGGTAQVILGTSSHAPSGCTSDSFISGILNVTSTTQQYEFQTYMQLRNNTNGLGVACNAGADPNNFAIALNYFGSVTFMKIG